MFVNNKRPSLSFGFIRFALKFWAVTTEKTTNCPQFPVSKVSKILRGGAIQVRFPHEFQPSERDNSFVKFRTMISIIAQADAEVVAAMWPNIFHICSFGFRGHKRTS